MANLTPGARSYVHLGGGVAASSLAAQQQGLLLTTDQLRNMVTLLAGANSSDSTAYYALYPMTGNGASTPYEVPTGKVLDIVEWYVNGPTAGHAVGFGSGSATFSNATTSAPTGNVTHGNNIFIDTASKWNKMPFPMSWNANRFLYMRYDTSSVGFRLVMIGLLRNA